MGRPHLHHDKSTRDDKIQKNYVLWLPRRCDTFSYRLRRRMTKSFQLSCAVSNRCPAPLLIPFVSTELAATARRIDKNVSVLLSTSLSHYLLKISSLSVCVLCEHKRWVSEDFGQASTEILRYPYPMTCETAGTKQQNACVVLLLSLLHSRSSYQYLYLCLRLARALLLAWN